MLQLIAKTTTATLFCILLLQNSLCDANELHDFNQLLVAPISAVFGAHNAPKDAVYFYKSLFEKGWSLLLCLDSDNECTYLQVHPFNTRIILSIYLIHQPLPFQNNAAIAAGPFFAGIVFFLFVSIFSIVRSCSTVENQTSVKSSQISSKLNSAFSLLMVACATMIGCAFHLQQFCFIIPICFTLQIACGQRNLRSRKID
jgi:hypothetical protein